MIIPINGHILVQPLERKSYLPDAEGKGHFEEVGTVVALDSNSWHTGWPAVGDKVFFDSWLIAKYPTGNEDDVVWLVPFKDIRAIEKKEDLYYCNGADPACKGNDKCEGHKVLHSTYDSLKKDAT